MAVALLVGSVSLGLTLTGDLAPYDLQRPASSTSPRWPSPTSRQILAGRRSDQVLLPVVGMLGGISLLLMQRLPQDLVTMDLGSTQLGLGDVQLLWLVLAIAIATTLGIVVRSDSWLRRYKYTWAALGIGLLLLTFVFGADVSGQRLTLRIGPFSGQPSELLKVILVVFLAGYLSENRPLLIEQDTRLGPLRLPPLPVPRADGRDVGDRPRDRRGPARPRRGAAVLRGVPGPDLCRDGPAQPGRHRPGPVPAGQRG